MIRRFNRYELKYVLPLTQCEEIINDLKLQLLPDEHGGEEGYKIVSLYYDSPDLTCFWAKVEGIRFRRKVRLRIYPGDDISKVDKGLVEIKQRVNRTVQKRRLVLPLEQAEQLCAGKFDASGLDNLDAQVAEEVTFLVDSLHLQPTAITAYHRKAWMGELENAGLRVTFDMHVSSRINELRVNADAPNTLILAPDWAIMEVKANETVPDWLTSLLGRHRCQLRRVSKYCAGLAHLHQLNVLPFTIGPGKREALAPGVGEVIELPKPEPATSHKTDNGRATQRT